MNAPCDITHLHEVGVAAQGAPRKTVGGLLARQLPHDHCLVPVVPVRATVSWRMAQHPQVHRTCGSEESVQQQVIAAQLTERRTG